MTRGQRNGGRHSLLIKKYPRAGQGAGVFEGIRLERRAIPQHIRSRTESLSLRAGVTSEVAVWADCEQLALPGAAEVAGFAARASLPFAASVVRAVAPFAVAALGLAAAYWLADAPSPAASGAAGAPFVAGPEAVVAPSCSVRLA